MKNIAQLEIYLQLAQKNLLFKITFTRFFRMSQILTTKSKGNIGQQTLQIYINMGSMKNIIKYNIFFFWSIKRSLKDTDKKQVYSNILYC